MAGRALGRQWRSRTGTRPVVSTVLLVASTFGATALGIIMTARAIFQV